MPQPQFILKTTYYVLLMISVFINSACGASGRDQKSHYFNLLEHSENRNPEKERLSFSKKWNGKEPNIKQLKTLNEKKKLAAFQGVHKKRAF